MTIIIIEKDETTPNAIWWRIFILEKNFTYLLTHDALTQLLPMTLTAMQYNDYNYVVTGSYRNSGKIETESRKHRPNGGECSANSDCMRIHTYIYAYAEGQRELVNQFQ